MAEPFLGEIRIFSFQFAPKGWAQCNGQFLPINQNQALFSLLGTTYGGNGQTTFQLPNLQGRSPLERGGGFTQGQVAGEESHTLTLGEMPQHTHIPNASSNPPDTGIPTNAFWPAGGNTVYSTAGPNAAMNAAGLSSIGGNQPHTNMPPYLVLTFCIALQGIFPSRN